VTLTNAFGRARSGTHSSPDGIAAEGEQVAVLGLGRFGGAVGAELTRLGFDVLGIDDDERTVQRYTQLLTQVVEADITNIDALRQLGITEIPNAVVAVGSDLEASILATAALNDLGVPNIWAKAVSKSHASILDRVGAHHVVLPEHDMGHRVAHLVSGRMLEWFQLDDKFALVETLVPTALIGSTLAEANVRERFEVTVVCVRHEGGSFVDAMPHTTLQAGDVLVVAGETPAAEAFARLS
jgi:trk system potassium uptake protein TrkA